MARISRLVCLGNSCCLNSQAPLSTLSCFLMNLKLGKAALNAAWSRHSNLREQHPKVPQSRSRSPPKVANQPRGPNHSPYFFDTTQVFAAKMDPLLDLIATCCKIYCNLNYLKCRAVMRGHSFCLGFHTSIRISTSGRRTCARQPDATEWTTKRVSAKRLSLFAIAKRYIKIWWFFKTLDI